MTGQDGFHSGTKRKDVSKREFAHGKLAEKLAAEGAVLLKNDGLLPLDASKPAALFGSGAAHTVKGGIGSGDVNNRENVSIYQAFQEAGIQITSEGWLANYEKRYEKARMDWKEVVLEDAKHVDNPFDAYALNPFVMPQGCEITDADLEGAYAAVYVISRISGEGKDRSRTEGDYYLSGKEKEDLLYLNQKQVPTVLLLNVGAPVELTDILQEAVNIRAVLNISLPGQAGGHAAVDILFGKAAPGGRLTMTWAKRYEDYPSAEAYSHLNGNLDTEEYREGIYVGYRYFDSFGIEPLFPFGYGLSYTQFSIACDSVCQAGNETAVSVAVKNTGRRPGKEVVQIYITPPQEGLAKEYRRLAGFGKTGELQPEETQKITVSIEPKQLASFSKEQQAWVIEAGKYGVWIGAHIGSLQLVAALDVPGQVILERTSNIFTGAAEVDELMPKEADRKRNSSWLELEGAQNVPVVPYMPQAADGQKGRSALEAGNVQDNACKTLARQLPVQQLIPLLYGNITEGASTLGSAGVRVPGSAGETTEALEKDYGVSSLIMADGPAGLRLRQNYEVDRNTDTVYGAGVLASLENGFLEDLETHEGADMYYQYCTAFPVGTALAQTWDTALLNEFGSAVAVEMEEFHVDLWLAPGMNIQRNPLCGRNFEYYSEDPFLSGMLAAAVTDGVQGSGRCGVTIKHFACNNQEDNRMGVNACVSQRALREIYFRGFEIAVKKSAPAAIMSSYNKINGVHAADSRDLCTTVARDEWGFAGVIMSDWNTTVPEDGSIPWQCAAAGNDIIMPGSRKDDEEIRNAYARGELSEEEIRSCAERVLALVKMLKG